MHFDEDVLSGTLVPMVTRLAGRSMLTPSERTEVLRLAQGFACKDSAAAANVSPETIRARRKRIYRKLGVAGANDVIAALLAIALETLARGEDSVAARPMPTAASAGESSAAIH